MVETLLRPSLRHPGLLPRPQSTTGTNRAVEIVLLRVSSYIDLARHALAIVTLPLGLLYFCFKPSDALKNSLWQTPQRLFSIVAHEEEEAETLEQSTAPSIQSQLETMSLPTPESKWKNAGRTLLSFSRNALGPSFYILGEDSMKPSHTPISGSCSSAAVESSPACTG